MGFEIEKERFLFQLQCKKCGYQSIGKHTTKDLLIALEEEGLKQEFELKTFQVSKEKKDKAKYFKIYCPKCNSEEVKI